MASRSKCAQFFALLEIAFWAASLLLVLLLVFYAFPTLEFLEAIGMENEGTKFLEWQMVIANQIQPKAVFFQLHKSTLVLMYDLIIIFSATMSKIQIETIRQKRESIGPFLFGLNVISSGIFVLLAFIGTFGTVIARLVFVINGNIKDDLDNTLALHVNFALAFMAFCLLSTITIPQMRFLFTNGTQDETVLQQESNKKVDSEVLITEKNKKTDENPPSYSTICITSEN
jgi:hypothetical protein